MWKKIVKGPPEPENYAVGDKRGGFKGNENSGPLSWGEQTWTKATMGRKSGRKKIQPKTKHSEKFVCDNLKGRKTRNKQGSLEGENEKGRTEIRHYSCCGPRSRET